MKPDLKAGDVRALRLEALRLRERLILMGGEVHERGAHELANAAGHLQQLESHLEDL